MKELIQIHIGQAGVQIGESLWELLINNNEINQDGTSQRETSKIRQTIFNELSNGRYVPRAIFADLDPLGTEVIQKGPYKSLINQQNILTGKEDAADNYSRGRYTCGKELNLKLIDSIRKESEKCDSVQGFILTHSIMGGTGSGVASSLLFDLTYDYQAKEENIISFTVMPQLPKVTDILGIYNATFSLEVLKQKCGFTVLFDNFALYNILDQNDEIEHPKFQDINRLIASLCVPTINTIAEYGLSKLVRNIVPHYQAPMCFGTSMPTSLSNPHQSLLKMLNESKKSSNQFLSTDLRSGRSLSQVQMAQGDISPLDFMKERDNLSSPNSIFCTNQSISLIQREQLSLHLKSNNNFNLLQSIIKPKRNLSVLHNHTCLSHNFRSLFNLDRKLHQNRAFIHWYAQEGMEDSEHYAAHNELLKLAEEYEQLNDIKE